MPPIPELEAIRKAQILEAGLVTLSRKGIAKTTLDDVCREAGLSKGGLVHYYKTKDILFSAVFEEFFNRIFKRSADTMARFEDPLAQLLSFDWLYDASNEETHLGYPLFLDLFAMAAYDEKWRVKIQGWIKNWVALLSRALEKGIENNTFKSMDVVQVAQSISAIYQGVATRWFLGDESHSTAWAVETFQRGIMGVLSPYMTSAE